MSTHVQVDRTVCVGYASCMMIAPKVFEVDDEGLVVLLDDSPPDELLPKVDQAARSCPKSAIHLRNVDD